MRYHRRHRRASDLGDYASLLLLLATLFAVPLVIIGIILLCRLVQYGWRQWLLRQTSLQDGWAARRLQRSRQKATAGRDSLRARMHFFLHLAPDAKWGRTWDSFQALLAMLSCTIYVVNTYAPADECTLMPEQAGLVVELVTSALFTSDYVLQLFLAKRRIRHVLSLVALRGSHDASMHSPTMCMHSSALARRTQRLTRCIHTFSYVVPHSHLVQ